MKCEPERPFVRPQIPSHPLDDRPVRVRRGRHALYYMPASPYLDSIAVTYHKRVRGKLRQLTISDKLLKQVLTDPASVS